MQAHNLPQPATLLDIGCGPGPSSRESADLWPVTQVTGVDLSPYYIALAEAQERCVDWPLLAGLAPFLQLSVLQQGQALEALLFTPCTLSCTLLQMLCQ